MSAPAWLRRSILRYHKIPEKVERLKEQIYEDGPWDVLVAFSQGCIMTHLLAGHLRKEPPAKQASMRWHHTRNGTEQMPWRLSVFFCGMHIRDKEFMHLFETPLPHPTVHVFGKEDEFYDYGRDGFGYKPQEEYYVDPVILTHEDGHGTAGPDRGLGCPEASVMLRANSKDHSELIALHLQLPSSKSTYTAVATRAVLHRRGISFPRSSRARSRSMTVWLQKSGGNAVAGRAEADGEIGRKTEDGPFGAEKRQLKAEVDQLQANLNELNEMKNSLAEPTEAAEERVAKLRHLIEETQPLLAKKEQLRREQARVAEENEDLEKESSQKDLQQTRAKKRPSVKPRQSVALANPKRKMSQRPASLLPPVKPSA
eukprot:s932_g8.t1